MEVRTYYGFIEGFLREIRVETKALLDLFENGVFFTEMIKFVFRRMKFTLARGF